MFTVSGKIDLGEFFDFTKLYADRLNLVGELCFRSDGKIVVIVQGLSELIEMFEMAIWLGPRHSRIADVKSSRLPGINHLFSEFAWISTPGKVLSDQ